MNAPTKEIPGEGFRITTPAFQLPVMRGVIDRRMLVNFRCDPETLVRVVPAPFRLKLVGGFGLAGICLIRLKRLGPRWLPSALGLGSENAAHRIAVEWDEAGRRREGVFIPRRDTASRLNELAGGRLFPGIHHHASFQVWESLNRLKIEMLSDDGETRVRVAARLADGWPGNSVFASLDEASRFFQGGALGWSAGPDDARFDGLELRTFDWKMEPLIVERVESSFFDNRKAFPPGSVQFRQRFSNAWHQAPMARPRADGLRRQPARGMKHGEVPRLSPPNEATNPVAGTVAWSPVKSLWFAGHALIAAVGGCLTFSSEAVLLSFAFTVMTLCLGHTIGLHRLLVHRSFACPRWLEYLLVHLGTVVGMGGPFRILYMHDIRDWAQRHESCHAFFIHQNPLWKDFLWQLHCEIRLTNPPRFQIEFPVANDWFYRFLQRTWMLQQLPWAVLFYALGGIGLVVWGISVRVTVSLIGHWLVGYFAHNSGERDWLLYGHAVQGHNVPGIGLLTMGESWHNNHHAFPGSARLGLTPRQVDPGWWALRAFHVLGLAWDIRLPADLPERPELVALNVTTAKSADLPVESAMLKRESPRPTV